METTWVLYSDYEYCPSCGDLSSFFHVDFRLILHYYLLPTSLYSPILPPDIPKQSYVSLYIPYELQSILAILREP